MMSRVLICTLAICSVSPSFILVGHIGLMTSNSTLMSASESCISRESNRGRPCSWRLLVSGGGGRGGGGVILHDRISGVAASGMKER